MAITHPTDIISEKVPRSGPELHQAAEALMQMRRDIADALAPEVLRGAGEVPIAGFDRIMKIHNLLSTERLSLEIGRIQAGAPHALRLADEPLEAYAQANGHFAGTILEQLVVGNIGKEGNIALALRDVVSKYPSLRSAAVVVLERLLREHPGNPDIVESFIDLDPNGYKTFYRNTQQATISAPTKGNDAVHIDPVASRTWRMVDGDPQPL